MLPRLELIDLDQPDLTGYRRFISCWLSTGEGPTFVVDPGPGNTAPRLIARLAELGVHRLDWILLTHIHLDHGGAAADLLAAYPGARGVGHESAGPHLVAPERLWEGSRQVLGGIAERYGRPAAVPAASLAGYAELAQQGVEVIETPGHAPHHVSFRHQDTLFLGEAAGTFQPLADGRWYLRPATPPRFKLEVALRSLDRLLALDPAPARLAFAHHGLLEGRATELLRLARRQLQQWVDVVRAARAHAPAAGFDELADGVIARLREHDPNFGLGHLLDPDIAAREQDFTKQTLRGMVQYVDEGAGRQAG
ncbi:MAG: MBL fold metallo-hydrolase [Candidatus Krumholzibacteriia bacterium]